MIFRKLTAVLLALMLLALMLLAGMTSVFPATAAAAQTDDGFVGATSGKTGSCTWSLNGTALTIKGYGAMADYKGDYEDKQPWGYDITSVEIFPGVTYIGSHAFKFCEKLESVTIGNEVTRIGKGAFANCYNLPEIFIPDSVTDMEDSVFWYCTSMTTIRLPKHLDTFGAYMFDACTKLKRVDVPEGVTMIPYNCFFWCRNLETITLPSTLTELAPTAFESCYGVKELDIPESVTSIGSEAFAYCSSLEKVNIPDGITEIPAEAFKYCKVLQRLDIPSSVQSIGKAAFEKCSALTSLDIPDGVTHIPDFAFRNAENLADIRIPDSVTSFGDSAFEGTAWLTKQPEGIIYMCDGALGYNGTCPAELTVKDGTKRVWGGAFKNLTDLKQLNLPESVTEIGSSSFYGCTSLTDVNLPKAVTEIRASLFENCTSLVSYDIPDHITALGKHAFSGCTSLEHIGMSDNVTEIGEYAFSGCTSLADIYLSEELRSLKSCAFEDCTSLKSIVIPPYLDDVRNVFRNCPSLEKMLYCNPKPAGWSSTITKFYMLDTSGSCTLSYENHTLTVSGSGKMANYTDDNPAAWSLFPEFAARITELRIEDGVTAIGDNAFQSCTGLERISLPDSVNYVGTDAFGENKWRDAQNDGALCLNKVLLGCKGECDKKPWLRQDIETVACAAMSGSETLLSLTLPDGTKTINRNAFRSCPNLQSAMIPESVTSIGSGAFKDCPNLTIRCFEKSKAHTYAKDNNIKFVLIGGKTGDCSWRVEGTKLIISGKGKMKDTVTGLIGPQWGTDITEVVIEDGVTGIGAKSFSKLTKLTKVVIPESVTSFPSVLVSPFPSDAKITVYGYEGSKAQTYVGNKAFAGRITFKALGAKGDVEIDGDINVLDVTAVQMKLAELSDFTDKQTAAADVDGDGEITINDATMIQMLIAEMIDGFA